MANTFMSESPRCIFTSFEKKLLLEFVQQHKHIVENKQTNKVTVEQKNKVWDTIRDKFNASPDTNKRSSKQLIQCYRNLKKRSVKLKAVSEKKLRLQSTGGDGSDSHDSQSSALQLVDAEDFILPDTVQSSSTVLTQPDPSPSFSNQVAPSIIYLSQPAQLESVSPQQQQEAPPVHPNGTPAVRSTSSARLANLRFFRSRPKIAPAPSATTKDDAAIASETEVKIKTMEAAAHHAEVEHELRKKILEQQLEFYTNLNKQFILNPTSVIVQVSPPS